ncbi:hypothetical protein GCM10009799_46710 [Nocardiopsis rhodophaea]|uniref:N-acetyltransferase domain-containing protein n=2 Tax=Nocardiopsis rhodophaea TaxID=280238 RepID=A0ABN2TL84_9ACTN
MCELLPFRRCDAAKVAEWLTATECEALLRGTAGTLFRESSYAALDSGRGRAALVADTRGQVLGLVHFWELGPGVYEVGGTTADERWWRTGIGLEAAALLVDYLFEVVNCKRVEFTTGIHNALTVRLGLDDGMAIEAICRDYFGTVGGVVHAVKSGLTREEYYQPYPHYQPRVGRRLDQGRLDSSAAAITQRLDARRLARRITEEYRA